MDIGIHGQRVQISEAICLHTKNRLEGALRRHQHRVSRANVVLRDINGPRGGEDKACEIVLELRPSGRVVVKDIGDDLYMTVSRAARRVKCIMARELRRLKKRRHLKAAGGVEGPQHRVDLTYTD